MNLRDFYEKNGTDYDAFLYRLMGKEALAKKYIRMFLTDPTYQELSAAMNGDNFTLIHRKAHTLKGIALNLELTTLGTLCTDIVNSINNAQYSQVTSQFLLVKEEYERIVHELNS